MCARVNIYIHIYVYKESAYTSRARGSASTCCARSSLTLIAKAMPKRRIDRCSRSRLIRTFPAECDGRDRDRSTVDATWSTWRRGTYVLWSILLILSPRNRETHWAPERYVCLWPFLPFLPINTKACIAYETWYILHWGETFVRQVLTTSKEGESCGYMWARGGTFSLCSTGCYYFIRLSLSNCFTEVKAEREWGIMCSWAYLRINHEN